MGAGRQAWCQSSPIVMGVGKSILAVSRPAIRHLLSLPDFVNSTCVFPFIYNDMTHYSCISVHSDYHWCSLDKKFQGRWRYCTRTGEHPSTGRVKHLRPKEQSIATGYVMLGVG